MGKSCAACGQYCERYDFSKNQWRKGAAARCEDCVGGGGYANSYTSSDDEEYEEYEEYEECRVYGCPKGFSSARARDQHERDVHPHCGQCVRSFRDENALSQHSAPPASVSSRAVSVHQFCPGLTPWWSQ
jgi:hypothetical protein